MTEAEMQYIEEVRQRDDEYKRIGLDRNDRGFTESVRQCLSDRSDLLSIVDRQQRVIEVLREFLQMIEISRKLYGSNPPDWQKLAIQTLDRAAVIEGE